MNYLGIDPGTRALGVVHYKSAGTGQLYAYTLRPPGQGIDRYQWVESEISRTLNGDIDLVILEGPAYGVKHQQGAHDAAGIWWAIRAMAAAYKIPVAVVPPTSLKKFVTDKGNAAKDEVLTTIVRRYQDRCESQISTNHEADAIGLVAMGAMHCDEPILDPAAYQVKALTKCEWPLLPSDA